MATFNVQLVNKRKNLDVVIPVGEGQTIYDASLDAGLDLPYSCGTGNCSSCTGKVEDNMPKEPVINIHELARN